MPDTVRIVAPDGVELSYLDWRGHGEPILFLRGGALTAHSWDLVCLGLRDIGDVWHSICAATATVAGPMSIESKRGSTISARS